MISPFDMYFAFTPVIAMKSTGCLRFPECPRVGGVGRMIFFKEEKAVPWTNSSITGREGDHFDSPGGPSSHRHPARKINLSTAVPVRCIARTLSTLLTDLH